MGRWTILEVKDWSVDNLGGPGRVTVPPGGPRRVGRTSGRYETGRKTFAEVQDGSEDLHGGPGRDG